MRLMHNYVAPGSDTNVARVNEPVVANHSLLRQSNNQSAVFQNQNSQQAFKS